MNSGDNNKDRARKLVALLPDYIKESQKQIKQEEKQKSGLRSVWSKRGFKRDEMSKVEDEMNDSGLRRDE